jgi:hypothetical protein
MNNSNSVVKPKYKAGDVVIALESLPNLLTKGKEYIVGNVSYSCLLLVETDNGYTNEIYAWRFKQKEEEKVNEVDKEQYVEMSTSMVYDVAYKGDTLAILKGVQDGREITVNVEYLPSTHFVRLTKEMQKQQKKNEDLGVLANVTDEIRKLLDDNHVICHTTVNRDTKGLVEVVVMLGESV